MYNIYTVYILSPIFVSFLPVSSLPALTLSWSHFFLSPMYLKAHLYFSPSASLICLKKKKNLSCK